MNETSSTVVGNGSTFFRLGGRSFSRAWNDRRRKKETGRQSQRRKRREEDASQIERHRERALTSRSIDLAQSSLSFSTSHFTQRVPFLSSFSPPGCHIPSFSIRRVCPWLTTCPRGTVREIPRPSRWVRTIREKPVSDSERVRVICREKKGRKEGEERRVSSEKRRRVAWGKRG